MKLVLPVSHVDFKLAALLASYTATLGQMTGERCLVVATWSAAWYMDPILEWIRPAFGSVEYLKLATENEQGWPASASHLFFETCKHLHEHDNTEPWFWCEADALPLRAGWFQELKHEYEEAGKPYMGKINDSRFENIKTGERFIKGKHMSGVAVYPANFLDMCRSIHYVSDAAWDVEIGPEILQDVHDTKLISQHWGTMNYRREADGLIHCDSVDPSKAYNAGVIAPEACVNHGAKDFSLHKLLEKEDAL